VVRMVYARPAMSNALRDSMAAEFTTAIIQAIQASSLAEILDVAPALALRRGPGRPKGSTTTTAASSSASTAVVRPVTPAPAEPPAHRRRGRSTDADAELVVKYLRSHPGTPGEAARKSLGLEKNRWNTCVYRGIRDGKIRGEGERRNTRYWTVG